MSSFTKGSQLPPSAKLFLDSVQRSLRRQGLFEPPGGLLVAVSGGPDSTALLRALEILGRPRKIRIYAAHMNHGLRGEGSLRDEAFVRKLLRDWDVPLRVKRARRARSTAPSEEALRDERYRFLFSEARRRRASCVATGHTRDDQAETVLFRMLRGSGLRGISAIRGIREQDGIRVIRPLLGVTRRDVLDFLSSQKIPYRTDPSNRKLGFMRNRIRWRLLPELERRYNPRVRRHLADLAETAAETQDFVAREAARRYRTLRRRGPERVAMDARSLRRLHVAVRKEIFRLALRDLGAPLGKFGKVHLDGLDRLFCTPGAAWHLPGRVLARRSGTSWILSRGS